jgi:hypothetical protein
MTKMPKMKFVVSDKNEKNEKNGKNAENGVCPLSLTSECE